jgi:Zn-dependent protease
MSDLLAWSIRVGRWRDTQYRIHHVLLIFAAIRCLEALFSERDSPLDALAWALAITMALALHELAHALAAERLGVRRGVVCLGPLGEINRPGGAGSAAGRDSLLIALAGPAANLALALTALLSLRMLGGRMQLDPFGGITTGVPVRADGTVLASFTLGWWIGCVGHASWILALANLLPALPFDGGVAVRLWQRSALRENDLSPQLARATAVVLAIAGLFRLYFGKPGAFTLLALGLVIELFVRWEARQIEESGEFGDEPFGYDFSQGYTSLEASPPAVRPRRESALSRWHRLRSEAQRRRRQAREAADDQRLDAILEKIHREGRSALTRDEERFLVRQSRERKTRRGRGPS